MKECLGILISGSGTTMSAILRAYNVGELKLDIGCIISSNPNAEGIKRAIITGVGPEKIVCLDSKEDDFSEKLLDELQKRDVTVVTQNGWIPKTPENVIKEYKGRIFNQHPGPIPEFGGKGMYGIRVHHAVLVFRRLTGRDMWTEVVAQKVGKDLDSGELIKVRRVPILPSDRAEDLQERCLSVEHKTQIELLQDVITGVREYPMFRNPLYKNYKQKELLEFCKQVAIKSYP